MKPQKLILCAWGPYRNKQEVDFTAFYEQGIFLITGATGAGKTTIFDAISYALYGALSGETRDKERSGVRSDFAEPSEKTYVELAMEHGGKEYRIVRNPEYLRPKKRGDSTAFTKERENAILYYPDGKVLEGVKEVNAALQEILVLDYQQFKKISMIAQGEFARLLVASPKEKTAIFREIFGTGIYERFTQNLSVRARGLFQRISEQKHKLEEDIRLIGTDMDKSAWPEEMREQFHELTASEHWNYTQIAEYLAGMEQEAKGQIKKLTKDNNAADKQIEKLTAQITCQTEENQRILAYRQALEKREELSALSEEYQEKECKYKLAMRAAVVDELWKQREQLGNTLLQKKAELTHRMQEKEALKAEAEALSETAALEEDIRELLELKKVKEELEQKSAALEKEIAKKEKEYAGGQKQYLEQEKTILTMKAEYEEEDRRRRLSAIGLAAALLKEGQPCPVCGSISHPAPAKPDDMPVSEEHLEALKDRITVEEAALQKLHGNVVAVQTMLHSLKKQAADMGAQLTCIKERLAEEKRSVCLEYLAIPVKAAEGKLKECCERAGALQELLLDKERAIKHLAQESEELQEDIKHVGEAFCEVLQKQEFSCEEDFLKARMDMLSVQALQTKMTAYREKVAANEELCRHLQENINSMEMVELSELQVKLEEQKTLRQEFLQAQKLWNTHLSELKKVRDMMGEKLTKIETDSAEYGYVKDLENMASGNNARKLVFEQYVLAGYFEEILKAANLRFQKMTSGRYEMFRANEVSDGRVKDNLEIQVLDYYTGKYRSVRTLSGGESFKASLALALGMSDVIQAMSGGVRVDTLFVDEGFGALDSESLEQACDALMGLVDKNHLIGIISHVPELGERISNQLQIHKTSGGSLIRNGVY